VDRLTMLKTLGAEDSTEAPSGLGVFLPALITFVMWAVGVLAAAGFAALPTVLVAFVPQAYDLPELAAWLMAVAFLYVLAWIAAIQVWRNQRSATRSSDRL
jgi:hypothetical protein